MEEELKNEEQISETAPVIEGAGTESTTETTNESATPNAGWAEITDRFAPGTDTSNPQAILDALLPTVQKQIVFEDKIRDLIETNPTEAAMLSDWIDLGSLPEALAENYNADELKALWEEISSDDYEDRRGKFTEKVENKKAYDAHKESNRKNSQAGVEEFLAEVNPSAEDEAGFIKFTDDFLMDAADENLTKVRWMALWQAYKYPTDVATAEENGKIMGKNETIKSGKKTRQDLANLLPEGENAVTAKKPSYAQGLINSSPLKKLNL